MDNRSLQVWGRCTRKPQTGQKHEGPDVVTEDRVRLPSGVLLKQWGIT